MSSMNRLESTKLARHGNRKSTDLSRDGFIRGEDGCIDTRLVSPSQEKKRREQS